MLLYLLSVPSVFREVELGAGQPIQAVIDAIEIFGFADLCGANALAKSILNILPLWRLVRLQFQPDGEVEL
jgi:hypothetical protein